MQFCKSKQTTAKWSRHNKNGFCSQKAYHTFPLQKGMSHEVRVDRVPTVVATAASQASPSVLMHPSHLGLPQLAPVVPHGVLPAAAVLPTALSMHSPHLLAQMSHFLMSLRDHHQKLREAALTASSNDQEDKESTTSSITLPTPNAENAKLNNNNNEPQPLDLRLDSKKVIPTSSSKLLKEAVQAAAAAAAAAGGHQPGHHQAEDENRNLIDVVSMDSPDNEDIMDDEDDDMEEPINDDEECHEDTPSPNSVQSEIMAAHSAILSRFQNFPSSNIPPEALEQVQRTLKQMLAHASAKQSRAQASQSSNGKMERYVLDFDL